MKFKTYFSNLNIKNWDSEKNILISFLVQNDYKILHIN